MKGPSPGCSINEGVLAPCSGLPCTVLAVMFRFVSRVRPVPFSGVGDIGRRTVLRSMNIPLDCDGGPAVVSIGASGSAMTRSPTPIEGMSWRVLGGGFSRWLGLSHGRFFNVLRTQERRGVKDKLEPRELPGRPENPARDLGECLPRSLARWTPEVPSLFAVKGDGVGLLGLLRGGSDGSGSGLSVGGGLKRRWSAPIKRLITLGDPDGAKTSSA
jgi:hypothetical protein